MDITDINEMILFTVGDTSYGVDIRGVQEIKKLSELTRVYGSSNIVHGVVNLRGAIVSVLDGRLLLGGDSKITDNKKQRVIVLPFKEEQVGLLVDDIDDVITIERDRILPVPTNMDKKAGELFEAVYQIDGDVISIINREKLLEPTESPIA